MLRLRSKAAANRHEKMKRMEFPNDKKYPKTLLKVNPKTKLHHLGLLTATN